MSSPFDEYPKKITPEILASMSDRPTDELQDDLNHLLSLIPSMEHALATAQVNMQYCETFEQTRSEHLPLVADATNQLGSALNLIEFLQKVIDARQEAS